MTIILSIITALFLSTAPTNNGTISNVAIEATASDNGAIIEMVYYLESPEQPLTFENVCVTVEDEQVSELFDLQAGQLHTVTIPLDAGTHQVGLCRQLNDGSVINMPSDVVIVIDVEGREVTAVNLLMNCATPPCYIGVLIVALLLLIATAFVIMRRGRV